MSSFSLSVPHYLINVTEKKNSSVSIKKKMKMATKFFKIFIDKKFFIYKERRAIYRKQARNIFVITLQCATLIYQP